MDASKLVDDALAKVSDLGTVGAMKWLAAAIAPPVAAGSVDIAELRLMLIDHRHSDSRKEQDRHLDSIIYFVNAWGAQQREAGHREGYADGKGMADEIVAAIDKATQVRAEKAESELKAHVAQSEASFAQMEGVAEQWKTAAAIAEACVKELEAELDIELERAYDRLLAARAAKQAGRQALQAEGKHPAPCARDCEANAFRIEVRRLEAESAHKQAIIDRLMLEHCPDEMTAEQVKEWGEHQVRADPEQLQWPPKKDERLAGVSNKQLHILYDSLRAGKPDDTRDVEIADGVLALTRSQVDAELEARDDAPIPF